MPSAVMTQAVHYVVFPVPAPGAARYMVRDMSGHGFGQSQEYSTQLEAEQVRDWLIQRAAGYP